MTTETPAADGRRQRSRDNRARIVEAMLALVAEGDPTPGAEQVAARAGVGLRTVFRHFKDMDSLYGEMAVPIEAELRAIIARPLKATGWRERVVELVGRRAAAYEKIGPFKRASDINRHRSPYLQARQAEFVSLARELLERELPAELTGDRVRVEALDLLLSFESWDRLRRAQGLSPAAAAEVLETMTRSLLA